MPVLRNIESKIEGLFEGVFGRAFRTNVQPIELARKLVKEMDDHRNVSVSRVYVPNEYTIYLSPKDRKQFAGYETSLISELSEYIAEHHDGVCEACGWLDHEHGRAQAQVIALPRRDRGRTPLRRAS